MQLVSVCLHGYCSKILWSYKLFLFKCVLCVHLRCCAHGCSYNCVYTHVYVSGTILKSVNSVGGVKKRWLSLAECSSTFL